MPGGGGKRRKSFVFRGGGGEGEDEKQFRIYGEGGERVDYL